MRRLWRIDASKTMLVEAEDEASARAALLDNLHFTAVEVDPETGVDLEPEKCPETVTDDDGDVSAQCVLPKGHSGKCGF